MTTPCSKCDQLFPSNHPHNYLTHVGKKPPLHGATATSPFGERTSNVYHSTWKEDLQAACKVHSRRLAGAAIFLDFVGDLLTFHETANAGALNSRDVDENVLAALIGLNEAVAFLIIEPLNGAGFHSDISYIVRSRSESSSRAAMHGS